MKMTVIGIGPGSADQITPRALEAIANSDVIVGYGVYVELIKPLFPNKVYVATAMRREEERCRIAVEKRSQ